MYIPAPANECKTILSLQNYYVLYPSRWPWAAGATGGDHRGAAVFPVDQERPRPSRPPLRPPPLSPRVRSCDFLHSVEINRKTNLLRRKVTVSWSNIYPNYNLSLRCHIKFWRVLLSTHVNKSLGKSNKSTRVNYRKE